MNDADKIIDCKNNKESKNIYKTFISINKIITNERMTKLK